jgi:Tfp pilus assembly protein PilO
MKNFLAIFLILASVGIYYGYTKNTFATIGDLRKQSGDYKEALATVDKISKIRNDLKTKIDAYPADKVERLNKLLPDKADNVQILIDITNIGRDLGLTLNNININEESGNNNNNTEVSVLNDNSKYRSVSLSFSVLSTYQNFQTFLARLEKSLRVVDITELSVKTTDSPNVYNFSITLKTYWQK